MCTTQYIQHSCGCLKQVIHHCQKDPHTIYRFPKKYDSDPCYYHLPTRSNRYKVSPQSYERHQRRGSGYDGRAPRSSRSASTESGEIKSCRRSNNETEPTLGGTEKIRILQDLRRDYESSNETDSLHSSKDDTDCEGSSVDDYPYDDYPYESFYPSKDKKTDGTKFRMEVGSKADGQKDEPFHVQERGKEQSYACCSEDSLDDMLSDETLIPEQREKSRKWG
jgi:hypothetical protein